MIDRAVADAAFALKEGETSAPVQGRFGVALIHVVKIEPEQIRPLAEVAPEIKKSIATERAKAQILSVYDKIEDVRSEGHTLAEAADDAETGGPQRRGRPLRPRSRRPDRSRTCPMPSGCWRPRSRPRSGSMPIRCKVEDGYVWYEVAGITPAHDRTLDEVKDKVEASWREDQIATRLKDKAAQMLDKLKAGSPLAELAAAEGLKVETLTGLKRGAAVAAAVGRRRRQAVPDPQGRRRAAPMPSSRAIRWYSASPTSWCPRPT